MSPVIAAGVPWTGWRDVAVGPLRALDDVVAEARGVDAVRLGGGELLGRSDLPALLAAVGPAELLTGGASLRAAAVLELLRTHRASARVLLFSAVPACHDWLAGRAEGGAVLRGVRAAVRAGIPVVAEVVVTRPGMETLAATVEALVALGIAGLVVRPVDLSMVDADRVVALGARVGLLGQRLATACGPALRAGVGLEIQGVPARLLPPNLRAYAVDDALAPSYVSVFGDLELRASPTGETEVQSVAWTADEPRREVRRRLVRALEHRPEVLRVEGADVLRHPAAADLLREAVRSAPSVELAADLAPVVDWSDDEVFRVRKLRRVSSLVDGERAAEGRERLAAQGVAT